jgi:hypothetical protein
MGSRIDFTRVRDKKWLRDKQTRADAIPVFRRMPPPKLLPPPKAKLREVAEQALHSFGADKIKKLP